MSLHIELRPNGDINRYYSDNYFEPQCIGHLRMYFDDGGEFQTSWWPHSANSYNDEEFKEEFSHLVNTLRKTLLKSRAYMYKFLADHPSTLLEDESPRAYGYCVKTDRYIYYIRCTPERGNYSYIYCYLKGHMDENFI